MHRPKPWPFGKISRSLLRSWGFPLRKYVSRVLGGGSEVVSEFVLNFRAIWIVRSSKSSMLLSTGFCPYERSYLPEFLWNLFPWYPWLIGNTKLLEGLNWDCEICTRKYSLCPIFLLLCDGEGFARISSPFYDRIYLVVVFPHVIRRGDNSIESIEECC